MADVELAVMDFEGSSISITGSFDSRCNFLRDGTSTIQTTTQVRTTTVSSKTSLVTTTRTITASSVSSQTLTVTASATNSPTPVNSTTAVAMLTSTIDEPKSGSDTTTGDKHSLNAGSIVGISFGVLAALIIAVVLVSSLLRWRRRLLRQKRLMLVAPWTDEVRSVATKAGSIGPESRIGTTQSETNISTTQERGHHRASAPGSIAVATASPTEPLPERPSHPPPRRKGSSIREVLLERQVEQLLSENARLEAQYLPPPSYGGSRGSSPL
ncbi:hypothetical protein V5O48_004480 [Marasmius crinis-equi]|uniref:Transmembrane protein n=1 Tax=Marasmius crinis-equi TaxID=585013 RepID=A0ABR3FPW9_9AGAR